MTPRTRLLLALCGLAVLLGGATAVLTARTLELRYTRDVSRMVFNDNVGLLERLRRQSGLEADSLRRVLNENPAPRPLEPYIVVSIEDHRLWYRRGDSVLFTAEVGTGSGRILERTGGDEHWRFETPRGRLEVQSKELNPVWVAPEWHYIELAQARGLGVVRLSRGQRIPVGDGSEYLVMGSDVVQRFPNGQTVAAPPGDGAGLVAGGNVVIPPFGTNQRKFPGVLGTHRLNLGDGYAIHGTDKPETVGRSVSHGCIRLRNQDIAALYGIVPVGTPVFVY